MGSFNIHRMFQFNLFCLSRLVMDYAVINKISFYNLLGRTFFVAKFDFVNLIFWRGESD